MLCYGQSNTSDERTSSTTYMKQQANAMGQAFIKGDYQAFAKYTYPAIVSAMGGENRMANVLANIAANMKAQGEVFDNISFDNPTKIVKSGNELQCTLRQHTTIKLVNGRAVATSTLIAISLTGARMCIGNEEWDFSCHACKVAQKQSSPRLARECAFEMSSGVSRATLAR